MVLSRVHKGYFPFNCIEEDREFWETLTELGQLDSLIPFDILIDQNKIVSPFELNDDLNLPLIDSDPDIQFYNNQCNDCMHSCDYYLEDPFKKSNRSKYIRRVPVYDSY